MSLKFKFLTGYLVTLLASYLWQAMAPNESPNAAIEFSDFEQEILLVFPRLGVERESDGRVLEAVRGKKNIIPQQVELGMTESDVREKISVIRSRNISKIHVVSFGYGTIKAMLFASQVEELVESVLLVDPQLSTRLELLGDMRLNGAMKAFQLAWFWIAEHAVPHFGSSKSWPYNLDTSRLVFNSDQVKASSAFATYGGGIFVGIAEGNDESVSIYSSVNQRAKVYSYSNTFALADAATDWDSGGLEVSEDTGSASFEDFPGRQLDPLWGGFLLAVATLASEDFACIGGGLLAASGSIELLPAILGCLLGIFFGDLAIFFIGRTFGATALELPILRLLVSGKSLNKSKAWFEKRGVALVVLTRFFPGSRVPTYFAAGVVKVGWIRFASALLIASTIWTPILVLASFYYGETFLDFFESLGAGGWLGIVAVIVTFAVLARVVASLATWKGRRLLCSRWRRLVGWEFWPMWLVYLPVIPQILWLVLRYRSVSLPFSVNPCMPASGLVYESKIQILKHLEEHGVPIARFEAIPVGLSPEEKLERLAGFMSQLKLSYPVVLKPDIGQRGQGVLVANDESEARSFFEDQVEDTIAQEYIGGSEYGVFYQRLASREMGEVTSITDKRTTFVVGDGESTLEELILNHPRTVCMARFFLAQFEDRLEEIPQEGERFMLASIGTHSRGAVFLDGRDLLTPELQAAVDAFSKGVVGFHFGRYDLRVPSAEHLRRGEGIRVIELNGITSEPTHMYDPKHGPIFGWASLMHQWRDIFRIAKENRLAGHEPVSKRYVLRLAVAYFRGFPSQSLS